MSNQTSINENLIGAGLNTSNPTSTYVDFAEQIAKNQAEQASQEQALALAKEHVKQAKYQTKNEQDAQAAGYNEVLKDVMSPEEAVAYLNIVMKAKGLEIEQADIDAWAKTLPAQVNRQVVESFANRFARESTRSGQPVKFDKKDRIAVPAGMTAEDLGLEADEDPKFAHVPEDGMYQVVYDNQGQLKKFIPGGKEPTDPSIKAGQHGADQDRKDWKALGTQLTKAFTTRSGGLGSISTSIFRATRAINTIDNYKSNLTAQDLENIAQDIGAIFQGGAPTVESARGNNYQTLFTNFQNTFRKYTGMLVPTNEKVVKDTTDKMLEVLTDLRDSAIANIDRYAEFQAPIFEEITTGDPDRWEEVKKKYIELASSGLLIPPGENTHMNITGMDIATPQKDAKAKPTAKKSEMKLPAMDDIDAELAKRKSEKK